MHLDSRYGGYGILDCSFVSIAEKIKLVNQYIQEGDLVGKKLQILAENQQFESGLSTNIFRCDNQKARRYITKTWFSHLCDGLAALGISMYFKMLFPSSPTIMDVAMDFKLSDDQLMVLNNARIHKRLMHFGPQESYSTVEWPRRSASPADIAYLYSFMKNSMPPIGRKLAEEVKPLCHLEHVGYEKRLGTTITIA